MTIIGVTDDGGDNRAKVQAYIDSNKVEYTIALRGGRKFKTRGIPAAWLIAPDGTIVWQGNPIGKGIEELDKAVAGHIQDAWRFPRIQLPKDLKKADKYFKKGKIAKALAALEKYIADPKDPERAEAAQAALQQANDFGNSQLKRAVANVEKGRYVPARHTLSRLQKFYKGTSIGDEAKSQLADAKKDKKMSAEVEGAALLRMAMDRIYASEYKKAVGPLMKIARSKKFEGTRARDEAKRQLQRIESKL
ncbi:MAG: hypothetical protein V3T77_01265 [Planctomycetota bacterium]